MLGSALDRRWKMWGRDQISKAAQEVADHLQIVEHVKALQQGQRDLSNAVARLDDRIRNIEINLRALKAETALDAIKETQSIVNAVQGSLNQRIENLAVKVAILDKDKLLKVIEG